MGLLDSLAGLEGRLSGREKAAELGLLEKLGFGPAAQASKLAEAEQAQKQKLASLQAPNLARQLNRSGLYQDPAARTAVGLMMDPGTRQIGAAQAQSLLTPLTTAQSSTLAETQREFGISSGIEEERKNAYVANLTAEQAAKLSQTNLEGLKFRVANQTGLRKEVTSDPVLMKSAASLNSFRQLSSALRLGSKAAAQAAVQALIRVQEPGSVRAVGDRLDYDGSFALFTQMVSAYNAAASGKGFGPEEQKVLLALGAQLAKVNAQAFGSVLVEYQKAASSMPGVDPQMVNPSLLGVDPELLGLLSGP